MLLIPHGNFVLDIRRTCQVIYAKNEQGEKSVQGAAFQEASSNLRRSSHGQVSQADRSFQEDLFAQAYQGGGLSHDSQDRF